MHWRYRSSSHNERCRDEISDDRLSKESATWLCSLYSLASPLPMSQNRTEHERWVLGCNGIQYEMTLDSLANDPMGKKKENNKWHIHWVCEFVDKPIECFMHTPKMTQQRPSPRHKVNNWTELDINNKVNLNRIKKSTRSFVWLVADRVASPLSVTTVHKVARRRRQVTHQTSQVNGYETGGHIVVDTNLIQYCYHFSYIYNNGLDCWPQSSARQSNIRVRHINRVLFILCWCVWYCNSFYSGCATAKLSGCLVFGN